MYKGLVNDFLFIVTININLPINVFNFKSLYYRIWGGGIGHILTYENKLLCFFTCYCGT